MTIFMGCGIVEKLEYQDHDDHILGPAQVYCKSGRLIGLTKVS